MTRLLQSIAFVLILLSVAGFGYAQTDCAPPAQTDIPQIECEALLALYNSTNGPGWTTSTGWNQDNSPCGWHGVGCFGSGTVLYLVLDANQLSGSIPAELGNLSSLQRLFLSANQLNGSIPAQLGNLSSLQQLYLNNNQLSGPIPAQLGSLSNLQKLVLERNQLSGIPAELGNLSSLQELHLQSNQLSGSIPIELGNLSSLQDLYLNVNQLSGSIPAELGNLSSLQDLRLGFNQLSGSIPAELGSLSSLQRFDLRVNQLSGSIPAELGDLSSLQSINLGFNQLSGIVPLSVAERGANISCFFRGNDLCIPNESPYTDIGVDPICGLALGDNCDAPPADADGDGVADSDDLCPDTVSGADVDASGCSDAQVDGDGDGICDPDAPSDGPSMCVDSDNCPAQPNPGQEDNDADGLGDVCDPDDDNDGDNDGDDNCPFDANPDQEDNDQDGLGDVCDPDDDNDGVDDGDDNCPFDANPDQEDFDGDGLGDVCDPDDDDDGVGDADDFCPGTAIPEGVVPTEELGTNRWALTDDNLSFDTVSKGNGNGPGAAYTTEDTGGCSAEQIIAELGLGLGHTKFGLSGGELGNWVEFVNTPAGKADLQIGRQSDGPGDNGQAEIPAEYGLDGNYPNPFNPSTTIRFSTPESAPVMLTVYDLMGREVTRLVDGTVSAGTHSVAFDASSLPSGLYLYRLQTSLGTFTKTMLLLE